MKTNPSGQRADGLQAPASRHYRCSYEGLQIPIHRGHLLRFDRGQATDLMAATIPI
jgi:hypothetical protein